MQGVRLEWSVEKRPVRCSVTYAFKARSSCEIQDLQQRRAATWVRAQWREPAAAIDQIIWQGACCFAIQTWIIIKRAPQKTARLTLKFTQNGATAVLVVFGRKIVSSPVPGLVSSLPNTSL